MDTVNVFDTKNEKIDDVIASNNEDLESIKESVDNMSEEDKVLVEETANADKESTELESKVMNVIVDPETGEHKIIGGTDDDQTDFDKSFERMVDKINSDNDDIFGTARPISEEEALKYISSTGDQNILTELGKGTDLSNDTIRELLQLVNRRLSKEEFNVYKAMPDDIKKIVDEYVAGSMPVDIASRNRSRNLVAESLIDEFITEIQMDRAKNDFARELESIYTQSGKELADASIDYISDRNKVYREEAEKLEDPEAKKKLNDILDQIEEARALTKLKEFAKGCKIKSIEIEKYQQRAFNGFLAKYKESSNNIYDINLAKTVLERHLAKFDITEAEVIGFLVLFCKQTSSLSSENPYEHAYMYYVLYYCAMLDGDKQDIFKNNVIEVIKNMKERNSNLFK